VEGLIDFFEPIPNGQPFLARGSIAWAPVAFLTEIFRQIEFSNPNPADFFRGFITLKERTAQECIDPNSQVFRHAPIHAEHLRADETYAAIRHKFRPAVILAEVKQYPPFHDTISRELRRRFPSCMLCAPVHSLEERDGTLKVRPIFLEKLKSYQIPMGGNPVCRSKVPGLTRQKRHAVAVSVILLPNQPVLCAVWICDPCFFQSNVGQALFKRAGSAQLKRNKGRHLGRLQGLRGRWTLHKCLLVSSALLSVGFSTRRWLARIVRHLHVRKFYGINGSLS